MIEISNKHAGTTYTESDNVIPIPQSALREIYAYIVSRSCLSDDEEFEVLPGNIEWQERGCYEKMNLLNAEKVYDILWKMNSVKYENDICIEKKYIPNENDLKHLEENPQDFQWEFRILNSF